MKKQVSFKQEKPITVIMMAALLFFLSILSIGEFSSFIGVFLLALVLTGYKISYDITEDFNAKKVVSFFNIPIFQSPLNLDFPDYISLFGANYSKSNEWGPVAAIGTKSNADKIAIKLFNGKTNFTLFKSSNYKVSKQLAEELRDLLNVELIDNVKELSHDQ